MRKYKGTYLIGVSGGPDSMALFDMCLKAGNRLVCAHVNYHRRDSADRDEAIVRDYCEKHGVPFYKLDACLTEGNFQEEARKVRYGFFTDLIRGKDLDGVLVAHHLDDHLETYLLQKEHGGLYDHFGLTARTILMGVPVIRPLLHKEKKELVRYCEDNEISYGIDESNLTDDYRRNVLRHTFVEKMTKEEKRNLANT
ncbi:MAG: tRNA lysidine(34) synthetase TilS, partial [Erysipelotrichaceae bacterium]|nr:tRNA lysidine(34) synthetase TilS [Erysipelotrichaceae bacterium]